MDSSNLNMQWQMLGWANRVSSTAKPLAEDDHSKALVTDRLNKNIRKESL